MVWTPVGVHLQPLKITQGENREEIQTSKENVMLNSKLISNHTLVKDRVTHMRFPIIERLRKIPQTDSVSLSLFIAHAHGHAASYDWKCIDGLHLFGFVHALCVV